MATMSELLGRKVLRSLTVRSDRFELPDRQLIVYPSFFEWLNSDVRNASPFYESDIAPGKQEHNLIRDYVSGKPFRIGRLFKRLSPHSDDVWEMRTPDLRFFGWAPSQDKFVAVCGALFEELKADKSLYEVRRISVIDERARLDLDEPKFIPGADLRAIVSE